ncbi:hypothetical protein [Ruminococcus sp. HUN007]|uniref:DUF4352 domain-containing protein n=1 Tax=Ruminococcus sp. HUN007 TaxID=1514668 RepID=UPI0005D17C45|nr:hypothetical protein [Ruminococcus sp. HUN007]
MKNRFSALLAAGILAVACFTGCGEKSTTSVVNNGTPAQTEAPLPPGKEYTANKGEDYSYEDLGLKVSFDELALTSDEPDSKGRYSYAMVFTAVNNGNQTVDVRMLDDFEISIDGRKYEDNIFTAVSAANGANAYNGNERYDAQLEPGQTVSGFIPFAIDTKDWKELTVTYYPDRTKTNDTIVYTVDSSELVNKF